LPVEPYTFGYWLGDGYSETACFCTVDLQVLDEIQADGYAIIPRKKTGRAAEVYRFGGKNKQHMGDVLRKMNVLKNKHIPVKYLRASYEQRLALIQGIMDADGSINLRGRCEVTVISKKLACDICELAIGLGIKAYTDERKASCNGKDCGIAYRVSFTTTLPVFRLGRKLERIPDATRTTTKQRYIVNVRSVASVPVRCIQVNSQSHLYLAGHACIPTHNTTVQRLVLDALHRAGVRHIKLCAPTGKAAKRLTETSGMQATTVHRLVNWVMRIDPDSIDARPDVVIVDEASMLDTQVAEWLVNALPDYCHLILVGDDNQLPSVGAGRVLYDLISANVPMARLTKVLRQAGESKIISTSHNINNGMMPDLDNDPGSDMFLFEVTQPEKVAKHILRLITNAIPEKYSIEPDDITVIAPQYKHACGIEALNVELQAVLNEQSFDKNEVRWFDKILREGDKLIWTANNLDRGLVNGEECRVESIYQDNGRTLIDLDVSTGIPLDELTATHGYAVTVHKAQGSEYLCAIVVAHSVHQFMLTRRLLYTAVTRGKQLGIIIGERSAVQKGIGNIREDGRRTALTERLIALSSPDKDLT
jgi:exodeoxyribonuclease V alpha subunit